jgi:LDH2 family malate/lactate/ureidoglycolate dehydrogenase
MVYCTRVAKGLINPTGRQGSERRARRAYNGRRQRHGVVVAQKQWICHRARRAVRHRRRNGAQFQHYGIAAYYAFMAAHKGMIGMAFTTAPASIAPGAVWSR